MSAVVEHSSPSTEDPEKSRKASRAAFHWAHWTVTWLIGRSVVAGRGWRLARLTSAFAIPAALMYLGLFAAQALVLSPVQQADKALGRGAEGIILAQPENSIELARYNHLLDVRTVRLRVQLDTVVRSVRRASTLPVETTNWSSPDARSLWRLREGTWPTSSRDVAVSRAAQDALGVKVGDITRITGVGDLQVVGVVQDTTSLQRQDFLALPALDAKLRTLRPSTDPALVSVLLFGSPRAVAEVVNSAIGRGVAGQTRSELKSKQAHTVLGRQVVTVAIPTVIVIIALSAGAMVLRVRRAARQLAVLLACGVQPARLVAASHWAMAAVALIGGIIGCAVGVTGAIAITPIVRTGTGHVVGTPIFDPTYALATVGLVVVVAVASAWVPGRAARRGMAVFDGSAAVPPISKRRSILSAVLLVAGGVTALIATNTPVIAASVVATISGALLAVRPLLQAASRRAKHAGFAGEVALRQLARDGKRPVVAVTVGIATVVAAVGSLTYYSSFQAIDAASKSSSTPRGIASVPLKAFDATSSLVRDLRKAAGPGSTAASVTKMTSPGQSTLLPFDRYPYSVSDAHGHGIGAVDVVANNDDFYGIVGRNETSRERAALDAGHLVVLGGPSTGTPPTDWRLHVDQPSTFGGRVNPGASRALPSGQPVGEVVSGGRIPDPSHSDANFVVAPSFARARDLDATTYYINVRRPRHFDEDLGTRVAAAAQRHGIATTQVIFDSGALPPLRFDWRVVLAAATALLLIGIGLSILAMSEDARPFFASLLAVGVRPRRQRTILAIQAATIALLTLLLGVPLGVIVGVASVHSLIVGASITWAVPRIALLCAGCLAASAIIGWSKPGVTSARDEAL